MTFHTRPRKGFALAVAIVAIVLIGLLIAGSFFGSTQEYRSGRNALYQERALAAAEYGQTLVLSEWNSANALAMGKGQVVTRTVTVQDGAIASIDLTKLNMLTYSVVSEGRVAAGTDMDARRRTGMLIRLDIPEMRFPGAVTTSSSTNVTGTGTISGADANPPAWDCDPAGPNRAGIVNDNAADVTGSGTCSGMTCVSGDPKVKEDPLAGDPDTYDEFGGISYDSLTKLASITINVSGTTTLTGIGPSLTGGACNTSDPKNWGDVNRASPAGPCENYFPIIHAKGPGLLELKNGKGQGLLLVDGNLKLTGLFEFYGPIIVKGNFSTDATGNKVFGGVMAMNEGCVTSPCNSISGNAHIQYSRCALLSTLMMHARPILATRAWADMF